MTRPIIATLLFTALCALPCCKDKDEKVESTGSEVVGSKQDEDLSKTDRKFLSVREKLPPTEAEKKAERWTSLGISVESGWVIEMSNEQLVIENTDVPKKELAQHYLDKLLSAGWKETDHEGGDDVLVHTLERDDVELTVTGKDGTQGGSTVTISFGD